MENFLRKLKLVTDFTIEVDIDKEEFTRVLRVSVEEGSPNFNAFELLSSSNFQYVGYVGVNNFKFRRKQNPYADNPSFALVDGTYKQEGPILFVTAKINGFHVPIMLFLATVAFFFLIILAVFLTTGSFSPPLFLVLLGSIILLVPFFLMKRSVARMQHDLENLFYDMTNHHS